MEEKFIKKTILSILITLFVICTLMFTLTACAAPTHVHTFDKQVRKEEYFVSSTNCEHGAIYYFSCSCGEKGEETFSYGAKASHSFLQNGLCEICGKSASSDLEYNLINDGTEYEVSIGTCKDNNIIIPTLYNRKPVTMIAEEGFKGGEFISIDIPNSITTIGEKAFFNQENLSELMFCENSQLKHIHLSAFEGCHGLKNIEIPESTVEIGNSAFDYCNSLISVEIPSSTVSIGASAFQECRKLEEVTFYQNSQLKLIDDSAFLGCESLIRIEIPSSVEIIGSYALSNCHNLENIIFPENSQLKTVEEAAFFFNSKLIDITIPSNVETIEEHAYADCKKLTNIRIPESVVFINSGAFSNNTSLTSIEVDENNKNYKSIDGNLYTKNGKELLCYVAGKKEVSFNIPNHVTFIGNYAFDNIEKLTNISMPDTITSIGDYSFRGCRGVKSIILPSSLTSIGEYSFCGCEFKNIHIPKKVESIGAYAFAYCDNLIGVTFGENSQLKTIERHAFESCSGLSSLNIPASVVKIEGYVFKGCESLKTVFFRENSNLNSVGEYAFASCEKLEKVSFGVNSHLESIFSAAFIWCYNLTSIDLPSTVTNIYRDAFTHCPESLFNMDGEIRYLPTKNNPYHYLIGRVNLELTSYEIKEGTVIIAQEAFFSSYLQNIVIPNSVKKISGRTFYNNRALSSITFSGTVEQWNNIDIVYGWNDNALANYVQCLGGKVEIERILR